jgi:hypothetical protein
MEVITWLYPPKDQKLVRGDFPLSPSKHKNIKMLKLPKEKLQCSHWLCIRHKLVTMTVITAIQTQLHKFRAQSSIRLPLL